MANTLRFISGKGNEGNFLGLIRPDNSGVLLSSGKLKGKIVPIRLLGGKITEVPWIPIKKVLFSGSIRDFKSTFSSLIKNSKHATQGKFPLDDIRTMTLGPKNEEGFKAFTADVFKDLFFTDESHKTRVQMQNADSNDDNHSFFTCRGSTDLRRVIRDYGLGYKIEKFDWNCDF